MLPIFVTEEGSNAIESLKHSLNVQSSIEVIEGGSDTCSKLESRFSNWCYNWNDIK